MELESERDIPRLEQAETFGSIELHENEKIKKEGRSIA